MPTIAKSGWDPLGAWPSGRVWLWRGLAALVLAQGGAEFVANLRPAPDAWTDFFQDWASARNVQAGLPCYTDHRISARSHIDVKIPSDHGPLSANPFNAHPPAAVLLAWPFAWESLSDAAQAWNLASLICLIVSIVILINQLNLSINLAAIVVLTLLCMPLRSQLGLGQLNLVLLLAVVAGWADDRAGRPGRAGVWLGSAAAWKLFPALLVLILLIRGRRRGVVCALLSFLAWNLAAAVVLGPETFGDFLRTSRVQEPRFVVDWSNLSLLGFWSRLFDPHALDGAYDGSIPLLPCQPLAWGLTLASVAAVLGWLIPRVMQARTTVEADWAFGAAIPAMLLIAPISWDHGLVLLLLPLALAWVHATGTTGGRLAFAAVAGLVWANPRLIRDLLIPQVIHGGVATPELTLGIMSLPFYVLVGTFAYVMAVWPRGVEGEGGGG
jgi:hypothetical protein